jgi:hypothetical protein
MTSQRVMIVAPGQKIVALAQVSPHEGLFTGQVDLTPMPMPLQRLFGDYEETVNTQTFSLLDAVEEEIETLRLKTVFPNGHEVALTDLQIYPSTQNVSFKLATEPVRRPIRGGT